ncbi:hypothetical protein [Serinicoccus kebangsaanensis]|uniref:hypothetical protein n=1 Tax=Serinicoccus kebangsaanensis TaxID=2602069 RepID=UPI00124C32A3|nr:hypothetical protein [Serinicoccus kebangsaanensis]
MRWDQLFEDLAAQQQEWERREVEADAAEHTRAERSRVHLGDRLAADVGRPLRVRVSGVGPLTVRLVDVGPDWLLVHDPRQQERQERVVVMDALVSVEGLTGRVDDRPRRWGLRQALRAVSRDRARVRVHDREGDQRSGTIDRVLADHLDLARHADDEPRRAGAVRGLVSLPYAAVAMVQRL